MAQGVVTMSEGTTYGKASLERVASEETTPGNPPADTPDPPDTTGAPVLDDRMFSIGGNAGLIVSNVEGVHTGFALTARGDIFITPHLSFRADVIYAELFSNAEVILDGSPPPHDNARPHTTQQTFSKLQELGLKLSLICPTH